MFPSDSQIWDPMGDKQKALMSFLSNGMFTPLRQANAPAVSGLPPAPPSDSTVTASHETNTPLTPETDQKEADDNKVVDSHPGHTPDELNQYIQGQEKQVDEWGPAKQAALMQHLEQGYKSPGNLIAKGGATLADAIMQGVARAGSSGNLAAIDAREQGEKNRAQEMGKNLNTANLEGMREKQGLEGMSGKTPLGASQTPVLSAVLEKMGYPPEKVKGMLANPAAARAGLQPMADVFSATKKAQLEAELKKMELGMQAQNLALTHQEHATQQDIEKGKAKSEAAKALLARGPLDKAASLIPFTAAREATKTLENEMAGKSTGPLGDTTVKEGVNYKWSPTTGKYHKVK